MMSRRSLVTFLAVTILNFAACSQKSDNKTDSVAPATDAVGEAANQGGIPSGIPEDNARPSPLAPAPVPNGVNGDIHGDPRDHHRAEDPRDRHLGQYQGPDSQALAETPPPPQPGSELQGIWISGCLPQGTLAPSYMAPSPNQYSQAAVYKFEGDRVTFSIEEYVDTLCSKSGHVGTAVKLSLGHWYITRSLAEEKAEESREINMNFGYCSGRCRESDPTRQTYVNSILIYKVMENQLFFGALKRGFSPDEGSGIIWNMRSPFYKVGTQPTAPFIDP